MGLLACSLQRNKRRQRRSGAYKIPMQRSQQKEGSVQCDCKKGTLSKGDQNWRKSLKWRQSSVWFHRKASMLRECYSSFLQLLHQNKKETAEEFRIKRIEKGLQPTCKMKGGEGTPPTKKHKRSKPFLRTEKQRCIASAAGNARCGKPPECFSGTLSSSVSRKLAQETAPTNTHPPESFSSSPDIRRLRSESNPKKVLDAQAQVYGITITLFAQLGCRGGWGGGSPGGQRNDFNSSLTFTQ